MKLRLGFVSNSSTSSYIIALDAYENVFAVARQMLRRLVEDASDEDVEKDYKQILKLLKHLKSTGMDPNTGFWIPTGNADTTIIRKSDAYYVDTDQDGDYDFRGVIDGNEVHNEIGREHFFYHLEHDVLLKESDEDCDLHDETHDKFFLTTGELVCPICDKQKIEPLRIVKKDWFKPRAGDGIEEGDEDKENDGDDDEEGVDEEEDDDED